MKASTYIIFVIALAQTTRAQKPLTFDLSPRTDILYFNLDGAELNYFTDHADNRPDTKKSVNGRDNHVNLYLQWLNPLRYKLNWKDTATTDERDQAVQEFVSLLVGQFGTPVSDMNISSASKMIHPGDESDKPVKDSTEIRIIDFSDASIVLLLIHLRANQRYLNAGDVGEIHRLNAFFKSLSVLDDKADKDVASAVTDIYEKLVAYRNIKELQSDFDTQEELLAEIENSFENIDEDRKLIADEVKLLKIGDVWLKSYVTTVLTEYLGRVETKLNNDRKLTLKLQPVMEIIRRSIANPSAKYSDYFMMRVVEFDDGKKLETTLTITEYEFKPETAEFAKKHDVLNKTMVFRKHDIINVFASTGIFYGATTLTGFGVKDDFTIVEDNIERGAAVTAAFLNLELRFSRYFSPIIQIGADPTKRRPYFLLGTGFSIPAARIAISGGWLWTWDQKLDNLNLGDIVTSTTELDKHITYSFDPEPKGWYLGIQYKF